MKEIRIRFVKNNNGEFLIQKKTLLCWKYIEYFTSTEIGSATFRYSGKSKKKLLKKVLRDHFQTRKKNVVIIKYPTLLMI